MAQFEEKDLHLIEELCRIRCQPEEKPVLIDNIKKLLKYVETINEVNTDHISPITHLLADETPADSNMRKDSAHNSMTTDEFLQNAPEQIGGMVRVPPVIDKEE